MSDFRARILAELDDRKIPSQLKQIAKNNTLVLSNITLDTSGLPSQIQASIDKHSFTINLEGIKTKNIDSQIDLIGKKFTGDINDKYQKILDLKKRIGSFDLQIKGLDKNKNSALIAELNRQLKTLNVEYDELYEKFRNKLSPEQLAGINKVAKETSDKLAILAAKMADSKKGFVDISQVNALDSKMSLWLKKNPKAVKDYGYQIEILREQLRELNITSENAKDILDSINDSFLDFQRQAQLAGKTGKSFGAQLIKGFTSILRYIGISAVLDKIIEALKLMVRNVYDINTAMTELRKVTDETDAAYDRFLDNAGKKAQKLGTTISELIESTSDFARLGYSFSDSEQLAEVANIYAVVGDEIEGIDAATQSIISTMTAFKIEADDAIAIVDKFNAVGNKFAISSGGIGEALQRSASSLAAANNTLDQSIALITAANTVVQDADSVGTAYKTISMRIRGAKTELEAAELEIDGMAESTAKLREEILALSGVDIMLDEDTFKSTYDILDELSAKWEDLEDVSKANITELLAGKRQGNVFDSLMSNFDIARNVLNTSENSEGSALAEHEEWLKSLEAKVNQFKAAFQDLSQTILSDKALGFLIDGGTLLLNILNGLIDILGGLNVAIAGVGIAAFIKNFD